MAVKSSQIKNVLAQDTSRGPSNSIWADCPIEDIKQYGGGGVGIFGYGFEDDFVLFGQAASVAAAITNAGAYAAWAATGTTTVDALQEGGVIKIDGTTANKSFILTSNAGSFRLIGSSTNYNPAGKLWFECRVALNSIAASQQGVFIGLVDNTGSQINSSDTTVIASGGNTLTTTKNLIGFFNRTTTSPTDFSAVYQPAAGTAVYPTNLTTLSTTVAGAAMKAWAAGTDGQGTGYIKLGFIFDPTVPTRLISSASTGETAGNYGTPALRWYVNGQEAAAFTTLGVMQATTFPTGCFFAPVFNYMNIAGSTAPVYFDWWRCFQVGVY